MPEPAEDPLQPETSPDTRDSTSDRTSDEVALAFPWIWPAAVLLVIAMGGWWLGPTGAVGVISTVVILIAVIVGRLVRSPALAGLTWGVVLAAGIAILLPNLSAMQLDDSDGASSRASNPTMIGVDLSGADLRGSDLSGVSFRGADLSFVCFAGAILDGVDFSGADLAGADLSGASFDDGAMTDAAAWPSVTEQDLSTACD